MTKLPGGWSVSVKMPDPHKIGQPDLGQHYVIDGIKYLWTGRQWVTEEYLRLVMNPPREYEIYDKRNKRRAAIAATKRNKSQRRP